MKLRMYQQLCSAAIFLILEAPARAGHLHHSPDREHISGHRSECTLEEREKNFATFMMNGKFKSTSCPENHHYAHWAAGPCGKQLKAVVDTNNDEGGHATALVVGGNSGSDCVGFQRLLSGNGNFSLDNWRAVVRTHTGGRKYPMPVCGPKGLQEYPLAAMARPARTVCVEPLTANFETLAEAGGDSFWPSGLVMVHAAASDSIPPGGQLRFITRVPGRQGNHRGQNFGFERAHLDYEMPPGSNSEVVPSHDHSSGSSSGSSGASSSSSSSSSSDSSDSTLDTVSGATTPPLVAPKPSSVSTRGTAKDDDINKVQYVPATTVDALVATHLRGRPPSVLSIDTEGFDALVLRGAAQTLASGRVGYLEFEYHRYAPWLHMQLNATVAQLDGYGYECYWAQPVLVPLTCFQWDKFGGAHDWSNVVCAHRGDACWSAALKEAAVGP